MDKEEKKKQKSDFQPVKIMDFATKFQYLAVVKFKDYGLKEGNAQ